MSKYSVDSLLGTLRAGVATVTFTKVSGETRVMRCTLVPSLCPEAFKDTPPEATTPTNTIRVFDLEKDAWRSFKADSVTEVTIP